MPRLSRECIITEKIDGTNAQIFIAPLANNEPIPSQSLGVFQIEGKLHCMLAGSRTRWITPENDNFGFASWVRDNIDELRQLGEGHHFGEWWGSGIQRNYGLKDRRFSLFNVSRWCMHDQQPQQIATADPRIVKMQDVLPKCCRLVPTLYRGEFDTNLAKAAIVDLEVNGSYASLGFMKPEGIVIFHVAGNVGFKKTIEKDHEPKGKN